MLQRREQIGEFYGVKEYRALRFFDVHIGVKRWRSDVKRDFAGRHAGGSDQQVVRETARRCLDARWPFLDGMTESSRVSEGIE